jgi:hypothetical protein
MRRHNHFTAQDKRKIRWPVFAIGLLWAATLAAQPVQHDDVLAEMHKRLTTPEKSNYHHPLVFVGGIAELGPVFHGPCKSAVNQEVVFLVSRVLFGNDPGPRLETGYINCTTVPLPSPPFTLHAKVVVYCEQQFKAWRCLTPVVFTEEDLRKVESWTADMQDAAMEDSKRRTADLDGGMGIGSAMLVIQERLRDTQRLAQERGFVFVGEVSRNDEVRQKRCTARGVEHKVEYRVSEILWNYWDSLVKTGDDVRKGFIDCRQAPLPPPFVAGTKVIVYCEASMRGRGDICDAPVLLTDERLRKVRVWIEELRQREGDPVLLQIHQHLHDSMQLSPTHPLLLLGQVTWIEPRPRYSVSTITMLPTMRASVSRVLWGYFKESEITSVCPARDCSNLSVGEKVIVFCEYPWPDYNATKPGCGGFVSSAYTDENVRRVEGWAKEARQREPSLILEKIKKSLDGAHSDESWVPSVYRGFIESVGKADNGVPLQHFVDITTVKKTVVNLEFRIPFPHAPPAIEIGKPMITFCYQEDDICYSGDETTGIVEDSDEMFQAILAMIAAKRVATEH